MLKVQKESFLLFYQIQRYKYNMYRFMYFFASARPVFVWQYRCFLWQCTKAWARTCSSQRRFITTENNTTFKSPLNCVTLGIFSFSFWFYFWLLLLSEGSGKLYTNIFIKNMSELYSNYFFRALDGCQNIQQKDRVRMVFQGFSIHLLCLICMFRTFHNCLTEQTKQTNK